MPTEGMIRAKFHACRLTAGRHAFRGAVASTLLGLLPACAASASPATPPPDGFIRAAEREECWQYPSKGAYLIVPGPELEKQLLQQVAGRALKQPLCWFADKRGQITLIAGVPCASYDKFAFRKKASGWKLVEVEENELVMCDDIRTQ